MSNRQLNVVAISKPSGHRYLFFYDDVGETETLKQLVRFAADAELDFEWLDAEHLSRMVQELQYGNIGAKTGFV